VRFLKPGSDGKPASFVDVVFENIGEKINPFDQINWGEMISQGTTDLTDVKGVSIGEERFLSDWMREGASPDARGEFYRPDVVVGRNIGDFEVGEMARDGRPILMIGLGEINGRAGSVKITMPTHVPIDGAEVALAAKETLNGMSQSRVNHLMNFVEDENGKKTWLEEDRKLAAKTLEKEHSARVLSFESWLARRFTLSGVEDERILVEKILEEDYFKYPEMLDFAKLVNARRGLVAHSMRQELTDLMLAIKKAYQKDREEKTGKKSRLRVQFLVVLAVSLMDSRYPGFMAVPDGENVDDQDGRLIVSALGPVMMEVIRKAKDLVGSKEREVEDYLSHRLCLRNISELVGGTSNIDEAIEALEKKQKEIKDRHNDEADELLNRLLINLKVDRKILKCILEDRVYDKSSYPGYEDEGGFLEVLNQINVIFVAGREVLSNDNEGIAVSLEENMNSLFHLSLESPLLTKQMIEDAAKKEGIIIAKDGFEFRYDRGEGWIKEQLKHLRRTLLEKVAEEYYESGAVVTTEKMRNDYKKRDKANVQTILNDLGVELEKAGEVLDYLMKHPEGSASSVSVDIKRTEAISKNIKFFLKAARRTVAAMEPEESTSGLLILDDLGVPVVFQSALAENIKMDLATIDGDYSIKVSVDNPTAMLEVVLPYLRSNKRFVKELLAYCIKNDAFSRKDQKIMDEMLRQDGYAGFMDRGNTKTGRKGGYREKRFDATIDAYKRQKLVDEARVFFKVLNRFMTDHQTGEIDLAEDVAESVDRFTTGGFSRLWEAQLEYRARSYLVELANLLYIIQMGIDSITIDPSGDYLRIRTERAIAKWAQEEAMSYLQSLITNDLKENTV